MSSSARNRCLGASGVLLLGALAGCGSEGGVELRSSLRVTVTAVDNNPPPPADAPLPPNLGDVTETWDFTVEALDAQGQINPGFNGFVRVSVEPGSVVEVQGPAGAGRNLWVQGGVGQGTAVVIAIWGPSRLAAEDLGYQPAQPGEVPACADGVDNDGDVLVDFPTDPGCAFANDMTEEGGTFVTGVSQVVHYRYPAVADVQGRGAQTPYPFQALRVDTGDPHFAIVTRVASSGFFLTDLADQANGFNSLYAYNFSTPEYMRVCDRLTYLSGTASEFFGFTELSFPSFLMSYVVKPNSESFTPEECPIPQPTVIDAARLAAPIEMEKLEAALGRINNWSIATKFGPDLAVNNHFDTNQSNCDFNGDGVVDYYDPLEGGCSDACTKDVECSEWYSFEARGNYKMHLNAASILVNTSTAFGFDPLAHKGAVLPSVTGTLRHFSGGDLNLNIETRCIDDLVCGSDPCPPAPVEPNIACITPRTQADNDEADN